MSTLGHNSRPTLKGTLEELVHAVSLAPARRQRLLASIPRILDVAEAAPSLVDIWLDYLEAKCLEGCAGARAWAMTQAAAVPALPVPLWLVSAPFMLSQWIDFARTSRPLLRQLGLGRTEGEVIVFGDVTLRSKTDASRATIRVNKGRAVAQRITLRSEPYAGLRLGDRAIFEAQAQIPETQLVNLRIKAQKPPYVMLRDVVAHPFFYQYPQPVMTLDCDGDLLSIECTTGWSTMAQIPDAAMAIVPDGYNPAAPWEPTLIEAARVRELVQAAWTFIQAES